MLRTLLRPTVFSPVRNAVAPRFFSNSVMRLNAVNFKINKESFVHKYMEKGPKSVKFTSEHEWLASFEDDSGFVGITNYASEALGDATYIELPEVGVTVEAGESIGSVESVKSASEIYSPVSGEIVAVNDALEGKPQLINEDPMGNGWIVQIKYDSPEEVETSEELLSLEDYESSLEEH